LSQDFPEGKAEHPVTDITWYEAAAYAAFRGKQLPTIFQWEKAARAGMASPLMILPWGYLGETVDHRANFKGQGSLPVTSLEFGMSPYGCYHPEANPVNFAPHIRGSKLMIHGLYDERHPLKIETVPLYNLLRGEKHLETFDGGHRPPLEFLAPKVKGWLDEKLGPVKHE
jgi:hypothetical protein